MARTSKSDVQAIFDADDLTDAQLQAFIDDASLVVDQFASSLDSDGARSEAVEKWFAAELATARSPRSESGGGAGTSMDYQRKEGGEFFQSDYGEKADRLSGGLLRETLTEEGSGMDWAVGTYAD